MSPDLDMSLTALKIKNAQSFDKPYKLADGSGSYLWVTPAGGKLWRLDYRFAGKRKTLTLGKYPDITLAEFRRRREDATRAVADGIDPSALKQLKKNDLREAHKNTFFVIASEYLAMKKPSWSEGHYKRFNARLKNDVFPWIGNRPISEIKPPEIVSVARRIVARDANHTAHRTVGHCGQVFRYALAAGVTEFDPTTAITDALPKKKTKHRAAITNANELAIMLNKLDSYHGKHVTRCACKLAPLTFTRPGELRHAKWADIDFDKAQWEFLLSKSKENEEPRPHIVPLSTQAVEILQSLRPQTGHYEWVFPGDKDKRKPMSESAVLAAIRRLGYSKDVVCGHGFRATARTLLQEELGYPVDLAEHQLGHLVTGANGRAYDRTTHLPARHKMMQDWADYIDQLKAQVST